MDACLYLHLRRTTSCTVILTYSNYLKNLVQLNWSRRGLDSGLSRQGLAMQSLCGLAFFFFFNQLIYFNWRLITLQYCSGFCHTLTWISQGCTCVPHPEPPSHLPPHPIPQGYPSALALSALFHASNLDWSSISHIVIYMFQYYSLKSSHPRLLPQSLKVCSKRCGSPK